MRVTSIGHAGLLVETTGGTVVCDPWFSPAYLGSWFPFPRNDRMSDATMAAIAECDVLYVSHSHRDHLDAAFLAEHVAKDATVVLPDFTLGALEAELRSLGFHDFVRCPDRELVDLGGGLQVAIAALDAPNVGPMGDSAILIEDPTGRILNQNDAHPSELSFASQSGPVDLHLLQHSGAIWFPMVYDIPDDEQRRLVDAKRRRQVARALSYIEMVDARHVVPIAGPPCFLDDDLFGFNDLPDNPTIFPDAHWFLQRIAERGHEQGLLTIPESVIELEDGEVTLHHPLPEQDVERIFTDKRVYLEAYRADVAGQLAAERADWPDPDTPLLPDLAAWITPLISTAKHTRAGVGAEIGLRAGEEAIIIDLPAGTVRAWEDDDAPPFWFAFPRGVIAKAVRDRTPDWVNEQFLSCRFTAHRDGPYNEYVYTFFKSLSPARMAWAERFYAEHAGPTGRPLEWVEVDGWVVEKRCPHQGAHLDKVGAVEDGVITCGLHGWQFDLHTGRCLTSEGEDTALRVRGQVERALG